MLVCMEFVGNLAKPFEVDIRTRTGAYTGIYNNVPVMQIGKIRFCLYLEFIFQPYFSLFGESFACFVFKISAVRCQNVVFPLVKLLVSACFYYKSSPDLVNTFDLDYVGLLNLFNQKAFDIYSKIYYLCGMDFY